MDSINIALARLGAASGVFEKVTAGTPADGVSEWKVQNGSRHRWIRCYDSPDLTAFPIHWQRCKVEVVFKPHKALVQYVRHGVVQS